MRSVLALGAKDLLLLWRDRFGMFWILVFPLLIALFFGSIFATGGGSGAGSMRVALATDNGSAAAKAFYETLAANEAVDARFMPVDSARRLVTQGKLTAYVHFKDTATSPMTMFGGEGGGSIEVGIDPARTAEKGYLQGLVTQAYFQQMQKRMMDPSSWLSSLDGELARVDGYTGLSEQQKGYLSDHMRGLRDFMGTLDASDTAVREQTAASSPFGGVSIDFAELAVQRQGPRSSWEITFPQSVQWALIAVAAAFGVSIVTERTRGTYLRLRLAPVGRIQILAGKGLACLVSSTTVCALLLAFGIAVFGIGVTSYLHLAMALVSSALCFVGLMMLISVLGKTEAAVAGAGWAVLLVFSMTGGGMVPLFLMPRWMATIGSISPVKWSIYSMEGAIWRGLSTAEMLQPVGILLVYGAVAFLTGVMILRRTDN